MSVREHVEAARNDLGDELTETLIVVLECASTPMQSGRKYANLSSISRFCEANS